VVERTRGYALRFEIDASARQIWDALVTPQLQAVWHPAGLEVDVRAGGVWRMKLDGRTEREAHIDVCLPPHRLRLVYMPTPGFEQQDAVLVDDIIIDASREGMTRLCVLGSGFPPRAEWVEFYTRVQAVWRMSCSRLKVLVEKMAGTA